ncbi:hypothetical protein BKA81DRAFT_114432 [Phyllosticta paracitricarpa]|uniref:Transmembrane protein n=1 Tax=Phyllosticta paracitricarpa TaxID=2016321 RepID=A0ABR1MX67_9PEZI
MSTITRLLSSLLLFLDAPTIRTDFAQLQDVQDIPSHTTSSRNSSDYANSIFDETSASPADPKIICSPLDVAFCSRFVLVQRQHKKANRPVKSRVDDTVSVLVYDVEPIAVCYDCFGLDVSRCLPPTYPYPVSFIWPGPLVSNLPPAFVANVKRAMIMAQGLRSKKSTDSPERQMREAVIQPLGVLFSARLPSLKAMRLRLKIFTATTAINNLKLRMMGLYRESTGFLSTLLASKALRRFKAFHLKISTNSTLNWPIPSAVQHHIFETAQGYYQQATLTVLQSLRNASSAMGSKTASSLLPQLPTLLELNAETLRSFTQNTLQDFFRSVPPWSRLFIIEAVAVYGPLLLACCWNWLCYFYRTIARLVWRSPSFQSLKRRCVWRAESWQRSAREHYWYTQALAQGVYRTIIRGVWWVVERCYNLWHVMVFVLVLIAIIWVVVIHTIAYSLKLAFYVLGGLLGLVNFILAWAFGPLFGILVGCSLLLFNFVWAYWPALVVLAGLGIILETVISAFWT